MKKPNRLLLSTAIEYLSVEVITVYFSLVYITKFGSLFVGLLITSLSLLGPVVLGPLAGALVDRTPVSRMWLPSALLAPILIVAATPVEALSPMLPALLVVLISVLGYVSTSTRIASSKHALATDEVASYHSSLATILHLIPIGAPFIAGLLLSTAAGPIVFVIIVPVALSCALVLYRSVVHEYEKVRVEESTISVANVTRHIRDASIHIRDTPLLLQSVLVASTVNFIGFANEYLAVRYIADLDSKFSVWASVPLMLSGFGSIVSAFFARYIDKVNYRTTLWYCQALAIVATLFCYSSSNPIVFCVALMLNGAVGATTAAASWSVRLRFATRANIGVLAGVTSSLYKIHSLLFLPLVGKVAGANGVLIGGLFVSGVALATLVVFFIYVWRRSCRRQFD